MLTYGLSADLASTALTELRAQPFFWNLGQPAPSQNVPSRLITSAVPPLFSIRNGRLSMDDYIGAFWVMTYTNTRIATTRSIHAPRAAAALRPSAVGLGGVSDPLRWRH